jgi:hypothetical protein
MKASQRLGRIVAVVLVLGAVLFVVGVVIERGDHQDEPAPAVAVESAGHDEWPRWRG